MQFEYFDFYENLLDEEHILVAGSTGSGKSVLINGFIKTAMLLEPSARFYLIDPKRVELIEYKKYQAAAGYADTPQKAVDLLRQASSLMEVRYKVMQREGLKKSPACPVYVIIDELADLVLNARKDIEPLLIHLGQLGRAANIHLVCATQRPTSDFLPPAVRVNLGCRIALHCATAIDSRNIIGQKGAETLPRFGMCFKLNAEGLGLFEVPLFEPPAELFP